jgi:hypothetical protein
MALADVFGIDELEGSPSKGENAKDRQKISFFEFLQLRQLENRRKKSM